MPSRLKVINLYGAPGVGKSTVRAGLFWLMKSLHLNVEEISEHAKELVHSGQTWQFQDAQLSILAAQHHRQLLVARAGYEYAVTDSPLALCLFYAPEGYLHSLSALVEDTNSRYENHNFLLTRFSDDSAVYDPRGRTQSLQEAVQAERRLREFLTERNIAFHEMPVVLTTPWRIVRRVVPSVQPPPPPAGL